MSLPDVSIVTAAYNSAQQIERTLESVRHQTIDKSRIEHIVVDDASTDGTTSVVDEFDAPYLRLIERDENSGNGTIPCNQGIAQARGEYVVMLDSDDEFLPQLIGKMVTVLSTDSDVDFVYSDYYEQFPSGERTVVDTGADALNTVKVGIMHQTEHLDTFDGYDPEIRFSEYDLLLRYLDAGLEGYHIPEPLFVYHRQRNSLTDDEAWVEAGEKELREKYGRDVQIREYIFE